MESLFRRIRRPQMRVRTLLWLIAAVAVVLTGERIVRDGPRAHWLLLQLEYGDCETRRSASSEIFERGRKAILASFFGPIFENWSQQQIEERETRLQRAAGLLIPALIQATEDTDPSVRAQAIRGLGLLAAFYGCPAQRSTALRRIIERRSDSSLSVRMAVAETLSSFTRDDSEAVIRVLSACLADPAVGVRRNAAEGLGFAAVVDPKIQIEVAPILMRVVASRDHPEVRIKAAWSLCYFGIDQRRDPSGPDVVPALITALEDEQVTVRRAAATILASSTSDQQGKMISRWNQRRLSIVPPLRSALNDVDVAVERDASLGLFALGVRDDLVIERMQNATHDECQWRRERAAEALNEWREGLEAIGD